MFEDDDFEGDESKPLPKVHYDYYTGQPLDEELYQKGRNDELQAMADYEVYDEIPISEAIGGKHINTLGASPSHT